MKETVSWLLSENNSDLSIELFDAWHFLYLFVILGMGIFLSLMLLHKSEAAKERTLRIFAYLTVGFYIADFFLMALSDSYGRQIAYDKLPFHICTLMGVMAQFAQFNKKFERLKPVIVTLSVASSLMWMVYPGSALGGQPPFCYRTLQTFMYHGMLFNWGFLNLTLGAVKLELKKLWQELCAIGVIMAWAAIGNALYDNENWLFINNSIFPFLSDEAMPLAVLFSIFGTSFLVHLIYHIISIILTKPQKESVLEINYALK